MESKNARLAAAIAVSVLLLLLLVLYLLLGLTKLFFLLAAADVALLVSVFLWVLFLHAAAERRLPVQHRQAGTSEQHSSADYSFLRKVANVPTRFRYEALAAATDGFRALVGRGSSAAVFKGILDDGTSVAVKQLVDDGEERRDREFRAEVSVVASIHHVNLVRLLGYCVGGPGRVRFLVYEFVHNGSLDKWIFPSDEHGVKGTRHDKCLPWSVRYRVAVDVAKALAYLHHGCRSRILHLDVKPENILLDEAFRAVVADFGLSRLMRRDESRVVTTVRGTRGYLAPEWLLGCGVSEKCDIYSYGMVLFELLSGRRNVQLVEDASSDQPGRRKWSYFPKIAAEKVTEGKVMELVDERLVMRKGGERIEEKEVRDMVHVALWCIQEKVEARPTMERVVDMLEGRMAVEPPPKTDMVVVDLLTVDQGPGLRMTGRRVHDGAPLAVSSSERDSMALMSDMSSWTCEMSVLSGR